MPEDDMSDVDRGPKPLYMPDQLKYTIVLSRMARLADMILANGDPATAKKVIDCLYDVADALE